MPDKEQKSELASGDFASIGALQTLVGDREDPSMHRNDTVGYNIVLRGEIYAKTDLGEVLLKPGDVLIRRGTSHTWHNRSDAACVFGVDHGLSAAPLTPRGGRSRSAAAWLRRPQPENRRMSDGRSRHRFPATVA